ncbi:MAG: hypothetical protein HY666_01345 [Chloroflexi bacterium]|nr:hypothetical protein [Chloroflexota bacterium]
MVLLHDRGLDRREEIFNFYTNLAKDKKIIYRTATLDVTQYPFGGAFRAQAHRNLVDARPLTAIISDQIVDTLGLVGPRRDIFKDYGVLVTDNNGLDETQLGVIKSILGSVPREMYDLTIITVGDFLETKGLGSRGRAGINIFGLRVSSAEENGFPNDVKPFYSDVFSLVAVHELNHRVKASYIDANPMLKGREEDLLRQAGLDDQNYLRSNTPGNGAFFQNAPQEFFASIANQYFASSEHTLLLGLERFNQGKVEPLNQFLFFADVYSRGGSSTLFYTLDTSGKLTRKEIQIERDNLRRIIGLDSGTNLYQFQLDAKGNVTAASTLPR